MNYSENLGFSLNQLDISVRRAQHVNKDVLYLVALFLAKILSEAF